MGLDVQPLRAILMVVCLIVFGLVFCVMLGSIWWRHRSGAAQQGNFHESVVVEMCWSLAPFAIVLLLVMPALKVFWRY